MCSMLFADHPQTSGTPMKSILLFVLVCAVAGAACGDNTAGTAGGQNATTNPANSSTNAANSRNSQSGGGVVTDPTCEAGLCTCPAGLVLCGTECVDLSVNTFHCGSCRRDCGSGDSQCVSGQCECGGSAVQCGNQCVDLSTDVEHCGDCGNDCNNNETCVSGVCQGLTCEGGEVACQGACVDVSADERNCGGCQDSCFGGELCQSGQCVCNGGTCADIGNDGRIVGGACSVANTCSVGSECLTDPDQFPDGMCSLSCQTTADCPDATLCVRINNDGRCLLACDQDGMCRGGYECRDEDLFADGQNEVQVCIADGG